MSKYVVFSRPDFPAFGLNTERNSIPLRIQSKCRKLRTRKNSVFGHCSRSDSWLEHVKFAVHFWILQMPTSYDKCRQVTTNRTICDNIRRENGNLRRTVFLFPYKLTYNLDKSFLLFLLIIFSPTPSVTLTVLLSPKIPVFPLKRLQFFRLFSPFIHLQSVSNYPFICFLKSEA